MGISAQGYGIHGTKEEDTLGQQVSLGCVRMRDDEVIELFEMIPSGTEVEIVDSLEDKVEAENRGNAKQSGHGQNGIDRIGKVRTERCRTYEHQARKHHSAGQRVPFFCE